MEETGKKVRKSNYIYRSVEFPFMQANIDRLIVGEKAGLECKTCNAYSAEKWKDGKIPEHYYIQCMHYMAVTGMEAWYIATIILGIGFIFHKIDRDEELIRNLIMIEDDFWHNHVELRIIPAPDGSKDYDKVLCGYFKEKSKDKEIPLVGFDEKLQRRIEIEDLTEKLDREKNIIDQELKLFLGECESASNEHYRVSWSTVISERLDSKKLKLDNPEMYKQYVKTIKSKRFTVRAIA